MNMNFDPGPGAAEGPFAVGDEGGDAGGEDGGTLPVIDISAGIFHSYASDLERLRRRIAKGDTTELKETARMVRDLRAATQLVLEERSKLDKLRKDIAGDVGAGCLDLDAARTEIGRRLACLRRAGDGG